MNSVFRFPYQNRDIVYIPYKQVLFLADRALWPKLQNNLSATPEAEDEIGLTPSDRDLLHRPSPFRASPGQKVAIQPEPVTGTVLLTGKCTCRCLYCYARGGETPVSMDMDMFRAIVDVLSANCVKHGVRILKLHFHGGGDISADWDLFRNAWDYLSYVATANGLKIFTSVGINGVLSEENATWIARNVDNSTVSIDGLKEVHDSQRPLAGGGGSFNHVERTLGVFDSFGHNYGLRMTITSQSVKQLPAFIEYACMQYGATKIKAEPMHPSGRGSSLQPPAQSDFILNYINAREIAIRYGRELIYSGADLRGLRYQFCAAAGKSYCFTPQGLISSCYEVFDLKDPLGDLFVFGEFDPERRKISVDMQKLEKLRQLTSENCAECMNCFARWNCGGDCPAKHTSRIPGGNRGDNYRCKINRAILYWQILEALDLQSDKAHFMEAMDTFDSMDEDVQR